MVMILLYCGRSLLFKAIGERRRLQTGGGPRARGTPQDAQPLNDNATNQSPSLLQPRFFMSSGRDLQNAILHSLNEFHRNASILQPLPAHIFANESLRLQDSHIHDLYHVLEPQNSLDAGLIAA